MFWILVFDVVLSMDIWCEMGFWMDGVLVKVIDVVCLEWIGYAIKYVLVIECVLVNVFKWDLVIGGAHSWLCSNRRWYGLRLCAVFKSGIIHY